MILERLKNISAILALSLAFWVSYPVLGQNMPPRDLDRAASPANVKILHQHQLLLGQASTTIQIPAAADVYIASERATYNFGDDALFLGYNLDGDRYGAERVFLYFDVLGAIPEDAIIEEARLVLHVSYANPAADASMGSVLRRVASDWDEYALTWQTEPTWGEIRASAEVGVADTESVWVITDLVSDWLEGTHPNYGVEIIGDERVQQRERAFFAREATSAYTPHLIVEYTTTSDTHPPQVSVEALSPYSPRHFEVAWSGDDEGGAGIDYYDVQYRIDEGAWADWVTGVVYTSSVYTGREGRQYEFRARGVDRVGNIEVYGDAEAGTTVDSAPPSSHVHELPVLIRQDSFDVHWSGTDEVSGIHHYDVRYCYNSGDWIPWQQETLTTEATFTALEDGIYAFEVRAVDNRGLREPFRGEAEALAAVDFEPPFIVPRAWLPFVTRQ